MIQYETDDLLIQALLSSPPCVGQFRFYNQRYLWFEFIGSLLRREILLGFSALPRYFKFFDFIVSRCPCKCRRKNRAPLKENLSWYTSDKLHWFHYFNLSSCLRKLNKTNLAPSCFCYIRFVYSDKAVQLKLVLHRYDMSCRCFFILLTLEPYNYSAFSSFSVMKNNYYSYFQTLNDFSSHQNSRGFLWLRQSQKNISTHLKIKSLFDIVINRYVLWLLNSSFTYPSLAQT